MLALLCPLRNQGLADVRTRAPSATTFLIWPLVCARWARAWLFESRIVSGHYQAGLEALGAPCVTAHPETFLVGELKDCDGCVLARPYADLGSSSTTMQSQVEIWATYIPSAQRTGKVFEVPASYLVPRIGAAFALAGALWFINPYLTWNKKPETLDPEFLEEAKRIGNVAVGLSDTLIAPASTCYARKQ